MMADFEFFVYYRWVPGVFQLVIEFLAALVDSVFFRPVEVLDGIIGTWPSQEPTG